MLLFEEVADFFEESGLVFFDGSGGFFFFVFVFLGEAFGAFTHFVESADHEENHKADDEEVNDGLEEVAVINSGGLNTFNVGGNGKLEGAKVEAADNHGNDWHNDVVDKGVDDGGEGTTDDDTDSEVHDRTAVDEFFELFKHFGLLFL